MAIGYVLCEYAKVKDAFPEYECTMEVLKQALIDKATSEWGPLRFGNLRPKAGQFGDTTINPNLFANAAGTRLSTWDQRITALGHQVLMQGVLVPNIPEDYKVGLIGVSFLDKTQKITEIRMDISDKRLPRLNLEEMHGYDQPTVVFENGFILDEETGFTLMGFAESVGYTRIKLVGLQLNRVPNKLQVTNPGTTMV
jgi:hypothetical protein